MKNEKLKRILFDRNYNIFVLIANVVIWLTWISILGFFITKSIPDVIIILIVWIVSLKMGKAKHYKSPLQCFIMQVLIFGSLFLSTYINIYIATLFTVFAKFLLSEHADIDIENNIEPEIKDKGTLKDLTLWDNTSKYQPLIDFLKYESSTSGYDDYLKAEEDLKYRVSTKTYLIYKRKFIDNKTFYEISEEFNIDNRNIVHELDKCYFFIIGRLGL